MLNIRAARAFGYSGAIAQGKVGRTVDA